MYCVVVDEWKNKTDEQTHDRPVSSQLTNGERNVFVGRIDCKNESGGNGGAINKPGTKNPN
ncbi:hypothetical protein DERP_009727 [Dermatophagoides pteronyssinus]|uniref:Uncharacterized protein n=1 Tax=Dermatophagoides pteronyssinus TaxID=6956 RepID=A0ABQ8IQZ6_DERPT|nr:hypothetical protein DERP_009727 [Dermatophagoides pteronyssinus]